MPLLLNVLRNANTSEYRKLRAKAMECAGLIGLLAYHISLPHVTYDGSSAIAVGREVFRADAGAFVELLIRIQSKNFQSWPLSIMTEMGLGR
jgi:hypothetical protein